MTVRNVRVRFCTQPDAVSALPEPVTNFVKHTEQNKRAKRAKRAFDREAEAKRVALTCSTPPNGASGWTLQLLQDRVIEMQIVEHVGKETIRQTLKKRAETLAQEVLVHSTEQDARFVAAIEDVLSVYARPYNAGLPVVCLDEAAKQLLGEVREPLPGKPGQVLRQDNEYVRRGTCALFMALSRLLASGRCWCGRVGRRLTSPKWSESW